MSIRQSMSSSLVAAALSAGGYTPTVLALSPSVQDDRLGCAGFDCINIESFDSIPCD